MFPGVDGHSLSVAPCVESVIRDGTAGSSPLAAEDLPVGSNVLVAGPALTGKRRLMLDLLGGAPDRASILVTTKKSAARMRAEFAEGRDVANWRLGMVDCVTRQRAVGRVADTDAVRYVSSAADLTGIGIATSGWMQEFYHDDDRRRARLGFNSLSTLLMYADFRRVYQFVHVITGRVDSSGFAGVFTMDTVSDDSEFLPKLKQLFDAMVEVREDPRELRVRGGAFGPGEWTRF